MHVAPSVLIAITLGTTAVAQGARIPRTVTSGSSITAQVAASDPAVEILDPVTGESTTHAVAPGKDATIPIPNVRGGTILYILIGTGLRTQVIEVEVITTGP